MNYFVKTRNWHCKKWVFKLLSYTHKFGVTRGDGYKDGDGKFCLETNKPLKAWLVWLYFILLSRSSGGWTYITRGDKFNGFTGQFKHKSIYFNYKSM